mmetsp:Transcript_17957/g.27297  ORF Transcript_17957/g.27297 Transcript_17957/m.27297 type:complete len:243 (+) Transcript_17957:968-1696(+)
MPARMKHQINLACRTIRPMSHPTVPVKTAPLRLARITAIGFAQDLERGPDVTLHHRPIPQRPPFKRHRPVIPAVRVKQAHRGRTPVRQIIPKRARQRRIAGRKSRIVAGNIPNHRPAARKPGQQHRQPLDPRLGLRIGQHVPQEHRIVPLKRRALGPHRPVADKPRAGVISIRRHKSIAARDGSAPQPGLQQPPTQGTGTMQMHHQTLERHAILRQRHVVGPLRDRAGRIGIATGFGLSRDG